ncbi:1277_t:CDS:2, partial [Gigaspora rosea]
FKKVVAMTQLQTEILQNQKSKEISKVQENFHNTNATTPLPRENSDSLSEVQKESSKNYNILDDEDLEEDKKETEDNKNEELELNSSKIGETHPADDNNLKWLLQDLFEGSL